MKGTTTDLPLMVTAHARRRMAQRNISEDHVRFVLDYGRQFHKPGGAIGFFLHKKDIPRELQRDPHVLRLSGITVIASRDDGAILTVYRTDKMKPARHSGARYAPTFSYQ